METRGAPAPDDRRRTDGLVFDVVGCRLLLGDHAVDLPSHGGNEAVLAAYVDLVASMRGVRPASLEEVRSEDVAALSAALDLDARDLRPQIEAALGVDSDAAVGLLIRLLQHRLVAGAALAAVGAVAVGSLAAGGPSAPSEPEHPGRARARHLVVPVDPPATSEPVVGGPVVVTDDGVGLAPPVERDDRGVVLVPAASVDAGPPAVDGWFRRSRVSERRLRPSDGAGRPRWRR